MKVHVFSGTPAQIGAACGMALAEPIRRNLRVLVWREGHEPLPREDRSFQDWWRGQEGLVRLHWRGATQLPQRPDVRARRGAALNFCRQHNGRCTDAQVRDFVFSEYHGGSAACVHNKGTIYLTVCNPQVEPNAIWVQEGFGAVGRESQFERLEV